MTHASKHPSTEHGFSIIETIIAMVILATVISAGAYASIVNDSVLSSERARSQKVQIAQKALSRIEGDLASRRECNRRWRTQDETAAYSACVVDIVSPRLTDSERRAYDAQVRIQPIDDPDDGTGRADADGNARDHYEARVSVNYAVGSTAGTSGTDANSAYVTTGRLDWGAVAKGSGTVRVNACALDRPDRAYGGGRCGLNVTLDGAEPESGARITLTPQEGSDANARSWAGLTNANGFVEFRGVEPGNYRVDATLSSPSQIHRYSPRVVSVTGAGMFESTVVATHPGNRVSICARLDTAPDPDGVTFNDPDGYGYEASQTNFSYHQVGGRVRLGHRITFPMPRRGDGFRAWGCRPLQDPLNYNRAVMYRGQYGLETQAVPGALTLRDKGLPPVPGSSSHRYYMVRGLGTTVCNNAPLGWPTTAYGVNSLQEPGNVLTNSMSGAVNLHKDGDGQQGYTICLDFEGRAVQDQVCQQLTWNHVHSSWHWHSWGWHDHGSNHVHSGGVNHWHPSWHEHGQWHQHFWNHAHNYDPPRWPPECFRRPDGTMVRLLSVPNGRNPGPMPPIAAQNPAVGGARRAI